MLKNTRPIIHINPIEKDMELTTNPCSSDRNCISKGALGKFFRKQDFGKIQRKKKGSNQQASLLCYLTPKNCEQSSKIIKQKFKENCSQREISSFLSIPMQITSPKMSKSIMNTSIVSQGLTRTTSIDKHQLRKQFSNGKIIIPQKSKLQLHEEFKTSRETARNRESMRNLRLFEVKGENEMEGTQSGNCMGLNYEKELKKLKNQCQHYSQLLQASNKEKQQAHNQVKSLNSLITELKAKNAHLTNTEKELSKEVLQLNDRLQALTNECSMLQKENIHFGEEKTKNLEEISYLKESINELNQRIEIMLESGQEIMVSRSAKTRIGKMPHKQPTLSKRVNSMCFVSGNQTQRQVNDEDNKLLIHELQDQLKYSQVEISMLKRVKLDINKKNEEFQKLQRQNKILKNQIFDMKTHNMIESQNNKTPRLPKAQNNKSTFAPQTSTRNNFQLGQRNSRAKDYDNKSESSDTLSLNLSLSPEKDRFRY